MKNKLATNQVRLSVTFLVLFAQAAFASLSPLKEAEDLRQADAPAIVAACRSSSARERAAVAVALGRIQKPESVNCLLTLAQDSNLRVARAAVFALGQLGWKSEFSGGRETELVEKLVPLLANKKLTAWVVEALGKLGLANTPALVTEQLQSQDESVKIEALLALYRHRLVQRVRNPDAKPADLPQDTIDKMLALAKDKNAEIRKTFAYVFMRVKDARAVVALKSLLHEKNELTRLYAVSGLKVAGADATKGDLLAATADASFRVRTAALETLLALGAVDGIDSRLAKDPSFHVRVLFTQAMSKAKNLAALQPLLKDPSVTVRVEAFKALVELQPNQMSRTFDLAFADAAWPMREAAVDASAALGATQESFLSKALTDRSNYVTSRAVAAFSAIKTPSAFEILKKYLFSSDLLERAEAVTGALERDEPEIVGLLWDSYKASPGVRWAYTRLLMVQKFAKVVNEKTTSLLVQAFRDEDPDVSLAAATELAKRGIEVPVRATAPPTMTPYRGDYVSSNTLVAFDTSKGKMLIRLFPEEAPIHCANFVGLIKRGYFNGADWYRVVSNFVVQGGGSNSPAYADANDYMMRAENSERRYERGTLGAPRNDGFDTANSDIFITHEETPHLNGQYTIFGKVVSGLDVIDRLERGDVIRRAIVRQLR